MDVVLKFIERVAPAGEYVTLKAERTGEVRSFWRADAAMIAAWLRKHRKNAPALCLLPLKTPMDRPWSLQDAERAGSIAVRAPVDRDNLAALQRFTACAGELPPPTLHLSAPTARTLVWRLNGQHDTDVLEAVAKRFAEVLGHGATPAWEAPVRDCSGQALVYWAPSRAYDLGPLRVRRVGAAQANGKPSAETPRPAEAAANGSSGGMNGFKLMNRIKPGSTEWLYPGVLPIGCLTLLFGLPKMGKTTIAVAMAATVSSGGVWPTGERCKPGGVILIEAEDPEERTTAQAMACGANFDRIAVPEREDGDGLLDLSTPEGIAKLESARQSLGGVALVIISPGPVHFGTKGGNDEAAVRARIAPFSRWVAHAGCAALLLGHAKKDEDPYDLNPRLAGSDVFKRVVRAAHVVALDKSDPEQDEKLKRRVMASPWGNVGPNDFKIFYRLESVELPDEISTSRIEWNAEIQQNSQPVVFQYFSEPKKGPGRPRKR